MKRLIICILILFSIALFAQEKPKYKQPEVEIIGVDGNFGILIISIDGNLVIAVYGCGVVQIMEFKDGKLQPKKCELLQSNL